MTMSNNLLLGRLAAALICLVAATAQSINIKLVGGRSANEGNVYVQHGSRWGLVCDDGWNARAGTVVCKQLGFKRLQRLTKFNHFKSALDEEIFLDDTRCRGIEHSLGACRHSGWFRHNCSPKEAAGVICVPHSPPTTPRPILQFTLRGRVTHRARFMPRGPTSQLTTATPIRVNSGGRPNIRPGSAPVRPSTIRDTVGGGGAFIAEERIVVRSQSIDSSPALYRPPTSRSAPSSLIRSIELLGGRREKEGYVKVHLSTSVSGIICPEDWGLPEAMVVCRELGLQYADRATSSDFFRGGHEPRVLQRVQCEGHEARLADCRMNSTSVSDVCSLPRSVAGVICTTALPDLLPNITTLVESTLLEDRYMAHLTCALEENCLSSSAYSIKEKHPRNWNYVTRRLLRFSSSIANVGTADFRPRQHRSSWEWHSCHMHYHSMDVFTHYDVLDYNGNRVAEGHKASFCLEDVKCQEGHKKRYSCRGHGNQGISAGCADVYKHDIDCQWIDITDLKPGQYIFKLNVNPELAIPELSYDNNAAVCDMSYSGYDVKLTNCVHRHGDA